MSTDNTLSEEPVHTTPDKSSRRQRINKRPAMPAIEDPLEFTQNKCSIKARRVGNVQFNVTFDLWFDKHYHDRHQFGEDDGNKRDGIEPNKVEELVRKATQYLLLCGSIVKGFTFINYNQQATVFVVIKEITETEILNVAIQTQYVAPLTYELTVKTARPGDDFKIAAGQYVLVFQEGTIELVKFENGKFNVACSL